MRQNFLKFKKDQTAAGSFQIGINKSAKIQNSMKVDEIII
jgi:hypothetical protein